LKQTKNFETKEKRKEKENKKGGNFLSF